MNKLLGIVTRANQRRQDRKWNKYKDVLLTGIDNPIRRSNYNTVLDNQRRQEERQYSYLTPPKGLLKQLLEQLGWNTQLDSHEKESEFMYQLTKRVLDKLICWDLVDVQSVASVLPFVYFTEYDGSSKLSKRHAVLVKTRGLDVKTTLDAVGCVELRKAVLDELSTAIAKEINHDLLDTLASISDQSSTPVSGEAYDYSSKAVEHLVNEIGNVNRRWRVNWAIMDYLTYYKWKNSAHSFYGNFISDEVHTAIAEEIKLAGILYVGMTSTGVRLYVSDHLKTSLLVGCKGLELDAGYIFSPYVLSGAMMVDSETYEPILKFKIRYAEYVTGKHYYKSTDLYKTHKE